MNNNNDPESLLPSKPSKQKSKWQRLTSLSLLKKLLYGTVTVIGIYGSNSIIYHVISQQNEHQIIVKDGTEGIIPSDFINPINQHSQRKLQQTHDCEKCKDCKKKIDKVKNNALKRLDDFIQKQKENAKKLNDLDTESLNKYLERKELERQLKQKQKQHDQSNADLIGIQLKLAKAAEKVCKQTQKYVNENFSDENLKLKKQFDGELEKLHEKNEKIVEKAAKDRIELDELEKQIEQNKKESAELQKEMKKLQAEDDLSKLKKKIGESIKEATKPKEKKKKKVCDKDIDEIIKKKAEKTLSDGDWQGTLSDEEFEKWKNAVRYSIEQAEDPATKKLLEGYLKKLEKGKDCINPSLNEKEFEQYLKEKCGGKVNGNCKDKLKNENRRRIKLGQRFDGEMRGFINGLNGNQELCSCDDATPGLVDVNEAAKVSDGAADK